MYIADSSEDDGLPVVSGLQHEGQAGVVRPEHGVVGEELAVSVPWLVEVGMVYQASLVVSGLSD